MGSGREGGSPSPAMASVAAPKQPLTSSSALTHRMERAALLKGGSDASAKLHGVEANANPNSRARTPRGGNTPLQSPRSMSPLRGLSSTEIASAEIASATLVDFQEAILRASGAQKSIPRAEAYGVQEFSMALQSQKSLRHIEDSTTEAATVISRRKSESASVQGGQQQLRSKSPFPASRSRLLTEDVNDQAVVSTAQGNKVTEMVTASPSEWVLLDRGKSPRRSKVSSSVAMETQDPRVERKSSRSSSRKIKTEPIEELPDADLGMGDTNRAPRRTHSRPHTRQHKRKASESMTAVAEASSPPESLGAQVTALSRHLRVPAVECQMPPYQVHHQADHHFPTTSSPVSSSSRRASREARMVRTSDWVQFMGDVIMWRHVPRSALLFGLGCFCIMSASMIQDMQYSIFSVAAHVALFYLAARFIKCNFLRGSQSPLSFGSVTEADAARLVRYLLPPLNLVLQKLGDLFSGEPRVTLKVAIALWFLARVASLMNVWSLVRFGFFALFTVPRCYSSYHDQIEIQVRNVLHFVRRTWSACGHKKALLAVGFLFLWNFSTVSTRVCGAFLILVGVRAYRHAIPVELGAGSALFNQEWNSRQGN